MKKTKVIRFGALWHTKRLLPKVLRLTGFLIFVYLAAMFVAWREARAQVSETLMGLGVEMLRYDAAVHQDAPRTLHLNGQEIHMSSGLTEHPLGRVLDIYEARCTQRGGHFAEQIDELGEQRADLPAVDGSLFDGTLREEDGDKGFVACLDTGGERLDTEGVVARLRRFRRTLDLSAFGEMRYIYAEQSGGTTLFVAFWTQGSFKVLDMFPPDGDAPGRDVEDVPRPPGARRILSAWEQGEPQSITVYDGSHRDPDGLEAWYRERMPDQGWHPLELSESLMARLPPERRAEHFIVWERGDEMISLGFGTDEAGLGTTTILTH